MFHDKHEFNISARSLRSASCFCSRVCAEVQSVQAAPNETSVQAAWIL